MEIHHLGDLPARSGMGSSSSFTVGLLHALYALQGRMASKHQLAMDGIHVEQDLLRETVGSQDQVMAAYGGLNHVRFLPGGEISVRPVIMRPERTAELNSHVMLFYTSIVRTASDVASTYVNVIQRQRRHLRIINDLVEEGLAVLAGDHDIAKFGELLDEAWQVKRDLSQKVSNARIDGIYSDAIAAGAVGGKLLGAGGGGFIMLFVPPDRQERVKQKLHGLIHVPCNFESQGSQIVFLDPEKDYSKEETGARAGTSILFASLSRRPGQWREPNEIGGNSVTRCQKDEPARSGRP